MLIGTDKSFIFYHIPKCGGMSVRNALTSYGLKPHKYSMHSGVRTYYPNTYSFSFVRNPWDRMVSMYEFTKKRYLANTNPPEHVGGYSSLERPFIQWLLEEEMWEGNMGTSVILPTQRRSQSYYVTLNDKNIIVDFVGKMENIDKDILVIFDTLNIPPIKLPKLNTTEHKNYREYYNSEARDFIAQHFKWEIEKFNYDF